MDRNNGLEVRISKEEKTTIVTKGLGEIPPIITRISLQDQTSHMGIIAQTMGDPLSNAQTSHSIEMMVIDLEMDLPTTRLRTGETMGILLVLQLKEETSHKTTPIANQEVINLTTLRSADMTTDQRLFHTL